MPPNYAIHVPKNTHDFHDVEICTVHGPRDLGGGSGGFESKLIHVMGFKRLREVHADRNHFVRKRFRYRHPPLASAASAIPIRDGVLAFRGPTVLDMLRFDWDEGKTGAIG